MTTSLAFLQDFSDAVGFIVDERTGPGGGQVGGPAENATLLWEHLKLAFAAMGVAIAVALPIGAWLGHTGKGSFLAVSVANIGRAVPSIALLFVFFAWFGATFFNVMLALALLAIPPILTNAYTGVREVDRDVVDAARGMGMTGWEILRKIELPMALPLVMGGIRTSAVNVVATATIAPLGGITTLGDPIISPNSYGDEGRLGAAIMVALLAVLTEVLLGWLQRAVTPEGLKLTEQTKARKGRLPTITRRVQPTP